MEASSREGMKFTTKIWQNGKQVIVEISQKRAQEIDAWASENCQQGN